MFWFYVKYKIIFILVYNHTIKYDYYILYEQIISLFKMDSKL